MNKYKILSGLKYNGTNYSIGDIIDGTAEEFESLVNAGVLKLDDGFETEPEVITEVEKPVDTWGPQPDAPIETTPIETTPSDTEVKNEVIDPTPAEEKVAEIEKNAVDITPEVTEKTKVEETTPEITGDNL